MVQPELATVEGAIQRGFHGQTVSDSFVHRFVVYGETVAAGVLGPVHGRVGMPHEVLR